MLSIIIIYYLRPYKVLERINELSQKI